MCQAPSSTSAAAEGDSGKGSRSAALPSHRNRQKSSQKKFGDGRQDQSFEKQLQSLQWAAKMQRQARSKGEKIWASRQVAKTKTKFAEKWLEQLKEKAEKSEVAAQTAEWRSTRARNDYERAGRLLEEKEELRKTIKRRFKKEIGKIEKINDELQELQVQAEASSAELKTEVVAAVHERSDLTEEVGSSRGCE